MSIEKAQAESNKFDSQRDEILSLLGKKKKPVNKKMLIIVLAIIIAAVVAVTLILSVFGGKETVITKMKEYTATEGNVVVGLTETSSVSIAKETIDFPLSATVTELFVSAGSEVKTGDPLIKFDPDEVKESLSRLNDELSAAELELQNAKIKYNSEVLKAEQAYETAKLNDKQADTSKNLSLETLQQNLTKAEDTLKEKQEQLADYQTMNASYPSDYYLLSYYSTAVTSSESAVTQYTSQKAAIESEIAAILAASGDATAKQAELAACTQNLASAQSQLSAAKQQQQSYSAYFSATYGNVGSTDLSELTQKIIASEKEVASAKTALEKAKLTVEADILAAEQKAEGSGYDVSLAYNKYQIAKIEYSQAIDTAQDNLDLVKETVQEAKALIGSDGIIYSPCDGTISSVSVEIGDKINVKTSYTSSQAGAGGSTSMSASSSTIMTISDIKSVSVPISVSEEDILSVHIGQAATVTMSSYPNMSFDAVVESVVSDSVRVGAGAVSYTVNVKFKDENTYSMFDGMSAEVTIIKGSAMNVVYVNKQAVTFENGISTVMVKGADENGIKTEIKTGFCDGTNVEIKEGLSAGDIVFSESAVSKLK